MMRAIDTDSNYENFYATCPYCEARNIFNRADDLKTFEPISRLEVNCQNSSCQLPFVIGNDSINMASEMLLFEAEKSLNQKNYMLTVMLSVQAIESYINQFFVIELGYKNLNGLHNLEKLNCVTSQFGKKVQKFSFAHFLNLTLSYILLPEKPKDLDGAIDFIININQFRPCKPSKKSLISVEPKYSQLVDLLYNTKVNEIRNDVAHKNAYRPSRETAKLVFEESSKIIYMTQNVFDARVNDINWYIRD